MAQTLTHSPADIISRLLIDGGLGEVPGSGATWPVHVADEPDSPDNCITVYDTAGTSDGRGMVSGELFSHDGFQVRIRAKDHPTGWTKADAIQTFLAESVYQERVTIDGTAYDIHCIAAIGDILPLGREPGTARQLFTLNATVPIAMVS